MHRRVHKRALSRDEAVIECDCAGRRSKGLGRGGGEKIIVSDSETADVASHNRRADRRALITPTITPVARELSLAGTASRGIVSRVDWPLPAIHPSFRDLSKGAPVFSFHSSLNAAPGRRKKSAYYSAGDRKRMVTNGECTVSLAVMRSRPHESDRS